MTARLLDVTPAEYLALPHFSASVAIALIQDSEAHAKLKYDQSRAESVADMTDEMIRGAVVHHLVFGKGARFEPVPFKDYRTDAAKDTRDKYLAAGIIPVLTHKLTAYEEIAKQARRRMSEAGIDLRGESELAIEWDEDGLLCRCMIDHLEGAGIVELKITDNAHPDAVERNAENMGYRIPAAAYVRALKALRPELAGRITYTFVFFEPREPWACYIPDPDSYFLDAGERDWLNACATWKACLAANKWPHYQRYQTISRPRWKLRQEGISTDEW